MLRFSKHKPSFELNMALVKLNAVAKFWRAKLAALGLIQRVFIGLVVLNVLVISLAIWSTVQSRVKYDESAALETRNVAQLLGHDITQSMHAIDLSLQTLVSEVEAQLRAGRRGDAELSRMITRLQFLAPDIAGLRIANAKGLVTQGAGLEVVSIEDRDYFTKLRDGSLAGLVVSEPLVGKITKVWGINLVRAIHGADGSFAGVAFAFLPLSRFTRDYAALATGPGGSFTLFDPEQRIIVRSLGEKTEESVIGKKFTLPALQALLASGRTEGSYRKVSEVDGIERVFFYRQIKGFPLGISVGRSTHDYLVAWRIEVFKTAAVTVLFVLSTLFMFWFILRAWRLQLKAVEALNSANQTLLVEQNFSQAVFESSPFAMYVRDHKGFVKHWNPAAERLFGWSEAELLGKTLPSVPMDKIKESEAFRLRILNGESILQYETQRKKRDGTLFDLSNTSTPLRHHSGEIDGFLTIALDITARKASEIQIEFLAYRDVLTGLPNRLLLIDRFHQAVAHADREGCQVALLFLDLDSFKTINDSLGHAVGDAMLLSVAERLAQCVRGGDTISRQGGDEFMIVLSDLRDREAIKPVLRMINERLHAVFDIEGHKLTTVASIGVSIYPLDGKDFETLLKKADTAMYRAKGGSNEHYRFFDEQMNTEAVEHLRMKNGMRQAIERHEFSLFYQPQIDLVTGAVVGVESLIRWNDPEHGMISPGKFIPVTESSELIVPIGEWVIHEACRQAVAWRKSGLPPLVMAVNISAVQFRRGDVEKTVIHALKASGLEPRFLELELTESVLIHDTELVLSTVQRLKRLGVTLSIDDFGTGYSSLSYLKRFDVDKLKIDQSFIRDLSTNTDDMAIVRAIIQMAKSLNLKTIAEGVETEDLVTPLQMFGCDEAQGYHFAQPMTASAFAEFHATWQSRQLEMVGGK